MPVLINNVTVYPSYIHHPYDYMSAGLNINESTVSIHHFTGSWMEASAREARENTRKRYADLLSEIKKGSSLL